MSDVIRLSERRAKRPRRQRGRIGTAEARARVQHILSLAEYSPFPRRFVQNFLEITDPERVGTGPEAKPNATPPPATGQEQPTPSPSPQPAADRPLRPGRQEGDTADRLCMSLELLLDAGIPPADVQRIREIVEAQAGPLAPALADAPTVDERIATAELHRNAVGPPDDEEPEQPPA